MEYGQGSGELLFGGLHMPFRDRVFQTEGQRELLSEAFPDQEAAMPV